MTGTKCGEKMYICWNCVISRSLTGTLKFTKCEYTIWSPLDLISRNFGWPQNLTESQKLWGWQASWIASGPTPCWDVESKFSYSRLSMSYWMLNIFKDGNATACLGNFCPVLDHTYIKIKIKVKNKKKVFLMFKWNLLYFILCLLCLVLSLRTTGKSFVQSFLFFPIRYLSTWIRSPWDFASGRIVPAHSASPLIKDVSLPSSSLWCFSDLYLSMSVSFWDTKCQIQHSRCVSLVLSRGGGSPPSVCWWSSALCSPGGCWPLFQRDMVGSW